MDTYTQFLESERQSFPVRAAAVAAVLLLGLALPETRTHLVWWVALVIAATALVGGVKAVLLPRFRSDAWLFGLLVADSLVAMSAVAFEGAFSPALALPVLVVGYYGLLLGYRGAAAGAVAGSAAFIAGAMLSGSGLLPSFLLSAALFPAEAVLVGFLATERFRHRDAREVIQAEALDGLTSRRILDGLALVGSAESLRECGQCIAEGVLGVTGDGCSLVFFKNPGGALTLAGASVSDDIRKDYPSWPAGSEEVATKSLDSGIAEPLSRDGLPKWAVAAGFRSGISAPLVSSSYLSGAACVYLRASDRPSYPALESVEQFCRMAARFVIAFQRVPAAPTTPDRLARELEASGRSTAQGARPSITLGWLSLDPATERLYAGDQAISLSRSEFELLYALAESPGEPLSQAALFEAMGRDDQEAAGSLDVTVHRLRRKLRKLPETRDLVQTVRGRGYMLAVSESAGESAPTNAGRFGSH